MRERGGAVLGEGLRRVDLKGESVVCCAQIERRNRGDNVNDENKMMVVRKSQRKGSEVERGKRGGMG